MQTVPTESVSCAICKGTGLHIKFLCEACDGNGKLQVVSPAKPCPACSGSGTATSGPLMFGSLGCASCGGTGWAGRIKTPDQSST